MTDEVVLHRLRQQEVMGRMRPAALLDAILYDMDCLYKTSVNVRILE
jgi:hypothetical protein